MRTTTNHNQLSNMLGGNKQGFRKEKISKEKETLGCVECRVLSTAQAWIQYGICINADYSVSRGDDSTRMLVRLGFIGIGNSVRKMENGGW